MSRDVGIMLVVANLYGAILSLKTEKVGDSYERSTFDNLKFGWARLKLVDHYLKLA